MNHPLQEVKEFQKRERAKRKAGKHPAAKLAAHAAKAITRFERTCNCAEATDTGDAWDLLYTLRSTFNEIDAQL